MIRFFGPVLVFDRSLSRSVQSIKFCQIQFTPDEWVIDRFIDKAERDRDALVRRGNIHDDF